MLRVISPYITLNIMCILIVAVGMDTTTVYTTTWDGEYAQHIICQKSEGVKVGQANYCINNWH